MQLDRYTYRFNLDEVYLYKYNLCASSNELASCVHT